MPSSDHDTDHTSELKKAVALRAVCLCAFFSLGHLQMIALSVPLWGGSLGFSAAIMGVAMASRSLLPLVYSIHIGSLMDGLGVRRVLRVAALLGVILPLMHPVLPYTGALVVLQTVLGFTSAMCWLGAQTAIGQLAGNNRRHTTRFSLSAAAGLMVGPVLFGLVWQHLGAIAGFTLLSLWGSGTLLAVSYLRALPGSDTSQPSPPRSFRRLVLPDPAAYAVAMRLMFTAAGAYLVIFSMLRLAGITIQESFYPVLLQDMGYSAGLIGALVGLGNLASLPASMLSEHWSRLWGGDGRALAIAISLSLSAMAATPLLTSLPLLSLGAIVFGFGVGASMPGILNLMSSRLPLQEQGVAAGLRATANRLAAFALPLAMGLLVEIFGIAAGFWMVGGGLICATALAGFAARHI